MLARGVLCRLGVAKTSARDLPALARILQRTLLSRNASTLPAVRALSRAYASALDARRSYATTTTATKPTATVKKAVKATAAGKAAPKQRGTTKAAAAKNSKTVKKPKAAAKPKAKKGPKKAAAKKILTPEEKAVKAEAAKVKKQKVRLTELRKTALVKDEPASTRPISAYNAYLIDLSKGKPASGADTAVSRVTEMARKWKTLTPAEHEVGFQITYRGE